MSELLKSWFLYCTDQEKLVLLACLSHELTIHGRAIGMDLVGSKQIQAFKGLNELQHQISQHVAHLGDGTNDRSGEQIFESLQGCTAHYRLSPCLKQSLDRLERIAKSRGMNRVNEPLN